MFISFPWDSMLVRMTEHKLASGEGVVVEYTLGEEGCSIVVDKFSYSSGYKQEGTEGVEVLEDRGILVRQVVPLVPWVPYILEHRGIHDIRVILVVPCILVVQGVLAVGKALVLERGMVVVGVVVGEEVRSMIVCRPEHRWQDIRSHMG